LIVSSLNKIRIQTKNHATNPNWQRSDTMPEPSETDRWVWNCYLLFIDITQRVFKHYQRLFKHYYSIRTNYSKWELIHKTQVSVFSVWTLWAVKGDWRHNEWKPVNPRLLYCSTPPNLDACGRNWLHEASNIGPKVYPALARRQVWIPCICWSLDQVWIEIIFVHPKWELINKTQVSIFGVWTLCAGKGDWRHNFVTVFSQSIYIDWGEQLLGGFWIAPG